MDEPIIPKKTEEMVYFVREMKVLSSNIKAYTVFRASPEEAKRMKDLTEQSEITDPEQWMENKKEIFSIMRGKKMEQFLTMDSPEYPVGTTLSQSEFDQLQTFTRSSQTQEVPKGKKREPMKH